MSITRRFFKYVSLNILGMIGLSCYILADSYFIAKAQGADGLTALNLVLPIYNLIFAIGAMIGIGSAIRYVIASSKNDSDADSYFFNAFVFTTIIGLVFSAAGFLFSDKILYVLGADESILASGTDYTRIFMLFAPIFMWNYIANAYVRNDNAPTIAMIATLSSSIFNIAFDYILMFPLNLGMAGAALATALSPVIGILVCSTHLLSKKSKVKFKVCKPSLSRLFKSCQVGISAFIGEISSGVITLVFNFLILGIAGNTGVAAYGVVANVSLVVVSVFNGIAQGSQPLISENYGCGNSTNVKMLRNLSFITVFFAAILLYAGLFISASGIVSIFNSENSELLASYAVTGIKLYFTGIFFSGLNIIGSSFFSATENASGAFWISILRGFVLIIVYAIALSILFGMNGIWLAYCAAEMTTCIVMLVILRFWAK